MTEIMYRELTPEERKQASEQKDKRTQSEQTAYRLLPRIMRQCVERNPAIAFKDCNVAFFPDLFLRYEKICVEIDGGYHFKRQRQDEYRDKIYKSHGFIIIRIKNRDTRVNVAFWERLLEGLNKVENVTFHPHLTIMKEELRRMISDEIRNWTHIDADPI